MMSSIEAHFQVSQSPAMHERLRTRAEATQIKLRESIDEYFDRHFKLSQEMTQAQYPMIEHEVTTTTFIIRGLLNRLALAPSIPTLVLQKNRLIRALRTVFELLMALVPASSMPPTRQENQAAPCALQWCELNQALGSHSTSQCRQQLRYCVQVIHPAQWNSGSPHPYTSMISQQSPTSTDTQYFSQRGRDGRRRGRVNTRVIPRASETQPLYIPTNI